MNAPNNESRDSVYIIMTLMGVAACWGFWYVFHESITLLARNISYAELWLLSRIVSDPGVAQLRDIMHDKQHYAVDWPYVRYVGQFVGIHYLRYPVAFILALLAYLLVVATPKANFRKSYSLDRLIGAQARIWPVIAPIIKFDPGTNNSRDPNGATPEILPLFAEALSPAEWLRYNKIPFTQDGIDREATAQALAEQLGERWRGPEALPFHAKALFAVFALKAARQRDEADKLLGELALCADSKNDMILRPSAGLKKEVQRIVSDPKVGGEAAKIASKHAFVTTALMRLLRYARERGGVLAPAQFLWLRGADRALWYPLNNVGRQSYHAEAAGAVAHFQAEFAAGTALISPKVGPAISSLGEFDHRTAKTLAVAEE